MKSIDSQSKIKRTIIYWVIITCFFLIALYIVSGSPFSSNGVKKFNNGYGTFDMKSYDARIVHQVLGDMKEQGFTVYKQYLVCDFLFIFAYGAFQFSLTRAAFQTWKIGKLSWLLLGIPVARGIADAIENVLLWITLYTFPHENSTLINISSNFTFLKLSLIKVWVVLIIIGFIGMVINSKGRKRIRSEA
ncbi:MAG TPA: hypothetical protein VHP81_07880 [Lachnospiraceae bacterium]|nr:hypothetical protein [Lachnospiraceae bacterium]